MTVGHHCLQLELGCIMIQTQSTHDSCTMKATRSIIFRTSNPYESLDLNTCKEVYNNTYLSFQYLNGRQMRQRQLKKSRFEKKLKQKNRCVEIPCIYIFIHTTGIRNRYSIVKSKSNRNNNSNSSSGRFRSSINCINTSNSKSNSNNNSNSNISSNTTSTWGLFRSMFNA